MSITRPRGEQIVFSSSKTGDHSLDAYLEACEKGSVPLYDMISQAFTTSGEFRTDIYEFRESPDFAGRIQIRVSLTINPLATWTDITETNLQSYLDTTAADAATATAKAAIATTKAAEAAASAASAAADETLATAAAATVTTNLPIMNNAIAQAASINFPTPTAADIGNFISVAAGGTSLEFKKAEGGSKPYFLPATNLDTYMVKKYEVVHNNFTPTNSWQIIEDATLHIIDLTSIDEDGNYVEASKTVANNFLFYDDLTLMADATLTISASGTVQGIAGVTGLAGSVAASVVAGVMTQAQLITSGAI